MLYDTYARILSDGSEYPWGASSPMSLEEEQAFIESWGTAEHYLEYFAPSAAGDSRVRRWAARDERLGATPRAAARLVRMVEAIDVRPILSAITVPTLVTHFSDDRLIPIAIGRYIADHMPGALFKEYPGQDHVLFWGDYDEMLDDIEEFLTGTRQDHQPDRVLATVLFTDIVDSTRHAAMLGDSQWRHLLGQHHTMVKADVLAFRGQVVKSTGDGVLATFDGPARAIRCASALRDHARRLGLEVRAGLHTGEIEQTGDDIAGIAVHIAARIAALATANEVLVSGAVPPLVAGSDLAFVDRGDHELKGVPGIWRVLAAV